jgi:hypothetical protein
MKIYLPKIELCGILLARLEGEVFLWKTLWPEAEQEEVTLSL